ncbi:MAG TPA: hypothetical protein VKY90_02535 [Candidatus Dormibacteraeota bacterium]|nr:hypothetical protein [Candidatus Dormibacteraeota bacterium]
MDTEGTEVRTAIEPRAAGTPVEMAAPQDDVSWLFHQALGRSSGRGRWRPRAARLGAILLAVLVCLVVALGVGAWPALWSRIHTNAGRSAIGQRATVGNMKRGAALASPTESPGVPVTPGPVASPVTSARPGAPSPAAARAAAGSSSAPPIVGGATAAAPTAVATGTATATPLPAVTWAHGEWAGPGAGCCYQQGGSWTNGSRGGEPGFSGPIRWTTSTSAWADWSLGNPSGGLRWDQVRVYVWIPNTMAGAWVRYTVTATQGSAQRQYTFDVPQQELQGPYLLGIFSAGTPTQRTGSIWVHMTYLRPYTGPAADATCVGGTTCTAMAAAQVQFQWS